MAPAPLSINSGLDGTEDVDVPDFTIPKTPLFVRQTLGANGMLIDSGRLESDYHGFHREIITLLITPRRSPKSGKSELAEQLAEWLQKYYTLPESQLMAQFVSRLVPLQRVPIPEIMNQSEVNETGEPQAYIVKQFSDDGLMVLTDQLFARDFLPCWHAEERKKIQKAMMKVPGMTTPKPDVVYGLWSNLHPTYGEEKKSFCTRAVIGVAYNMTHPFFLIEGKRDGGSLVEAENQACRGGACLVNARRILDARGGKKDQLGFDRDSFAFSMTLDYNIAVIWLHWCEIRLKTENESDSLKANSENCCEYFHMDRLQEFYIRRASEITDLISVINNILDWGCLQRKGEVERVLHDVWVREQNASKMSSESSGSQGKKRPKPNE